MLALGNPLYRPGGVSSEGQRPLWAARPIVSAAWEFAGSTASLPSLPGQAASRGGWRSCGFANTMLGPGLAAGVGPAPAGDTGWRLSRT